MPATELLNRPMLADDLHALTGNPRATAIRQLVQEYQAQSLPVLNGGFAYSNLREGAAQTLTCNAYRLWEYASLFESFKDTNKIRFLELGGAGSPLGYYLAELGHTGVAVELQPVLADVCRHVVGQRKLKLTGVQGDITHPTTDLGGPFELITLVSVLEHIPVASRPALFANAYQLLAPKGLFYLTFDYGTYRSAGGLDGNPVYGGQSESIAEVGALCDMITNAGFRFVSNDPRTLPVEITSQKSAPGCREIAWQYEMNVGTMDSNTPWGLVFKYVIKRLFHLSRHPDTRFAQHNFFRLFLERAG